VGAQVTYSFELKNKSVLLLRPYAPDGLSDPYSDAKKVEAGSYSLTANGGVLASNVAVQAGSVPVRAEVAAGGNITASYTAPMGYRHPDGALTADLTENNVTSWYPSSTMIPLDFPLVKGDVRLTGVTAAGGTPTATATGQDSVCSAASLPVDLWSGKTASLDIRAWDNTGEIGSPVRTNYSWSIVSDPSGVLTSITASTGEVSFSGATGTVKVRVTNNALPAIYHEMELTVVSVAPTNYARSTWPTPATRPSSAWRRPRSPWGTPETCTWSGSWPTAPGKDFEYLVRQLCLRRRRTVHRRPAAGGDAYLYHISGAAIGYTGVTPSSGAAAALPTNVLVTTQPITASTRLEIAPNPIAGTPGSSAPVVYWLRFGGTGAHDQQIPGAAVNAALGGGSVASLAADNMSVTLNALGSDTLTASLKCDAGKTATAGVNCQSSVGPVAGDLGILENTAPPKGGFLESGTSAEYSAYIAANGNAQYDAGETVLGYSEVSWSSQTGKVSLGAGSAATQVKVTGAAAGLDKLTATYSDGGTTHTASVDVLVYSAGYTFANLEVTPRATAVYVGGLRTFAVKAIFQSPAGATESYVLPDSMYEAWTALPGQWNTQDATIAEMSGGNSTVKGVAPGQALYVASVPALSANGQAEILVVQANATLEIAPNPVWIALGGQESITYSLSAPALSQADLLHYITASVDDRSVSDFGGALNQELDKLTGTHVGRTALNAALADLPAVADSSTVYVYDSSLGNGAIAFAPGTLGLNAGDQGTAQVKLIDSTGTAVATVDLGDLDLSVADTSVADIPAAPSGNDLIVTAGSIAANGSTVVSAVIPGTSVTAGLTVNVTGSGASPVSGWRRPAVIELWPGETKQVTVTDTLTGQPLNAAMLQMLTKTFGDGGASNDEAVDGASQTLTLQQTPGMTPGLNTLTVAINGQSAVVTILNFSQSPYAGAHTLPLEAAPDPAALVKGGAPEDVLVTLVLTENATGSRIDAIDMPADLLTWRANTQSNLRGIISVAPSAAPGETLPWAERAACGAEYDVTYTNGPKQRSRPRHPLSLTRTRAAS
jgi:hypothetical protein